MTRAELRFFTISEILTNHCPAKCERLSLQQQLTTWSGWRSSLNNPGSRLHLDFLTSNTSFVADRLVEMNHSYCTSRPCRRTRIRSMTSPSHLKVRTSYWPKWGGERGES